MTHSLSLSPLSVLPCSPLEQIDAALEAGFDAVGLRLAPVLDSDIDVMADAKLQDALRQGIATTGLRVLDVEVVRVDAQTDVAGIDPMLRFAAELGARWLGVTSARRSDYRAADEPAVMRRLSELCDAAARHDMGVALEFMPSRGIDSLEHAVRLAMAVGHPNLGITIDALHFYRSGGAMATLADLDPKLLACLQLCDGPTVAPPDLAEEARYERLYPGEGQLPLSELISSVPQDLPIAVEAPSRRRASLSVLERATESARSARRLLARDAEDLEEGRRPPVGSR